VIDFFRSLDRRGVVAGLAAMGLLALGIVVGSQNLRHYDPVLLTYTFGVLFSAFAIAYRYAVWLQRPPTRLYARRSWELARRPGAWLFLARAALTNLAAQRFIRRRGRRRWLTHFLIAWGCVLAGAVTIPLVFGWLHLGTRADDPSVYTVHLLNLKVGEFGAGSAGRFVFFNLLNLSAVMVIVGSLMALHRRLREPGAISRQQFGNDVVPLILLLAISATGLMLTFSMHALQGYAYGAISLVHALTVTSALLYIPYGKFFHVFQRPLQLGVALYRRDNASGPRARCEDCGAAFASETHLTDLRTVLDEMDLGNEAALTRCPACRRKRLGATHERLVQEARR
jgi:hypothetical protein